MLSGLAAVSVTIYEYKYECVQPAMPLLVP